MSLTNPIDPATAARHYLDKSDDPGHGPDSDCELCLFHTNEDTPDEDPHGYASDLEPTYYLRDGKLRSTDEDVADETAPAPTFTDAETATILAALRCLQDRCRTSAYSRGEIEDIATNFNTVTPLDNGQIDALCERINCGPQTPAPAPPAMPVCEHCGKVKGRHTSAGRCKDTEAQTFWQVADREPPVPTPDAPALLSAAAAAQTAFWQAMTALEAATGLDLESTSDLAGMTVQDLIDSYGPDGLEQA
jgi:hypothetical protein